MTIALSPAEELRGLTLMWLDNWWDGPLSGLAQYWNLEHYFEAVWDTEADDWAVPRVFLLYELDPDQRQQAWERHCFFEVRANASCPLATFQDVVMAVVFDDDAALIPKEGHAVLPVYAGFENVVFASAANRVDMQARMVGVLAQLRKAAQQLCLDLRGLFLERLLEG